MSIPHTHPDLLHTHPSVERQGRWEREKEREEGERMRCRNTRWPEGWPESIEVSGILQKNATKIELDSPIRKKDHFYQVQWLSGMGRLRLRWKGISGGEQETGKIKD